jgi:hypothetical protein
MFDGNAPLCQTDCRSQRLIIGQKLVMLKAFGLFELSGWQERYGCGYSAEEETGFTKQITLC